MPRQMTEYEILNAAGNGEIFAVCDDERGWFETKDNERILIKPILELIREGKIVHNFRGMKDCSSGRWLVRCTEIGTNAWLYMEAARRKQQEGGSYAHKEKT